MVLNLFFSFLENYFLIFKGGENLKKVCCPDCKTQLTGNFCENCQKEFNIVSLSVNIGLKVSKRQEADILWLLMRYNEVGKIFLQEFQKRLSEFQFIAPKKEKCDFCGKERKIYAEKDGKKVCKTCLEDYIFGRDFRKEVLPKIKSEHERTLKRTFIELAYRDAQSLFKRWLSENLGALIRENENLKKILSCKRKMESLKQKEHPEIEKIRRCWVNWGGFLSLPKFFRYFWRAREEISGVNFRINQKNRKRRRERLKALAKDKKRPQKEIFWRVIKDICNGCENLVEKPWGWECKLDSKITTKIPKFPETIIKISKESYSFLARCLCGSEIKIKAKENLCNKCQRKLILDNGEFIFKENGKRVKPEIYIEIKPLKIKVPLFREQRWIAKLYGEENIFLDTKRYPEIYCKVIPKFYLCKAYKKKLLKGEKRRIFFVYPLTKVIPVIQGSWCHIVVYGMKKTCVFSVFITQQGDQLKKVKFFDHRKVYQIRSKRPRNEKQKVRIILHRESTRIANYLSDKPGRVFVVKFKKEKYKKGQKGRQKLNWRLSVWSDSVFRGLLLYKLQKEGFKAQEIEFNTKEILRCPYCNDEKGITWQDLIVVHKKSTIICECCGKEKNAYLAIAELIAKNIFN